MNAKIPKLPTLNPAIAAAAAASPPPSPPPPEQQAPILGVAGDYEAKTVTMAWPMFTEALVYQTTKRWRACDVFVGSMPLPAVPDGFILSVFVYAVSQGARTLVASGRVGANADTKLAWVCAARTVAERYEITARVDARQFPPPATPQNQLSITVAASDEMTNPPDAVGELVKFSTFDSYVSFTYTNGIPNYSPPPFLEVMAARAANVSALPQWLFLFDKTSPGLLPQFSEAVMVWPLGPGAGYGAYESNIRYRCKGSPVLFISTSATAVVAPGADAPVSITVR